MCQEQLCTPKSSNDTVPAQRAGTRSAPAQNHKIAAGQGFLRQTSRLILNKLWFWLLVLIFHKPEGKFKGLASHKKEHAVITDLSTRSLTKKDSHYNHVL